MFFHGIGIGKCGKRGNVSWSQGRYDRDSVVAVTVMLLPLIPIRIVHTSNTATSILGEPNDAQEIPLRWSWRFVLAAFLNRWLLGILWLFTIGGIAAVANNIPRKDAIGQFIILLTIQSIILGFRKFVLRGNRRHAQIRWVLGQHALGSSDPATWTTTQLTPPPDPESIYGTATFADAVPELLAAQEFSRAMWAARLCTAIENRHHGELLTTQILRDPDVQRAIAVVSEHPEEWDAWMTGPPPSHPPMEAAHSNA
ncbi:hypothetical protein [Tuwongella immobilis]|uniref:Uncharacterized protein n=1 Tax=Tuwongella immobilis TaxID=692036 RepID=A0A6C2YLY0_9BACT|nr:hypothetical protein [Tuwongella immobilis]VIP02590.1 unnamed protein product [Tuwongella immobilis]VTS01858.1 unnamed protein product [Tuwongella immobilis]